MEVQSGKIDLISPGTLCDVAPDGTYILLCRCPSDEVVKEKGVPRRVPRTWKVDLATLKRTELPKGIALPKISPTGKYLGNLRGDPSEHCFVQFYSAQDWSLVREVGIESIGSWEDWITKAAWTQHP